LEGWITCLGSLIIVTKIDNIIEGKIKEIKKKIHSKATKKSLTNPLYKYYKIQSYTNMFINENYK